MIFRCLIGCEKNKEVSYVYCQYDGYLQGVGLTLQESYQDLTKIEQLIELGDMSKLAPELENCEFYHRDRGGPMIPVVTIPKNQYSNALREAEDVEVLYLFNKGRWYFLERNTLEFQLSSDMLVSRKKYE